MDTTLRLTIGFDNVYWKIRNGQKRRHVHFSLYSWRAASITAASMFGIGDDRIQALSGHASISEIGTYRRNELNRRRTELARMDYERALEEFQVPNNYQGIQVINNKNNHNNNNRNDNNSSDEDDYDDDDDDDDDDVSTGYVSSNNNNHNNHNNKNNSNADDDDPMNPSEISSFFAKNPNLSQVSQQIQQHNNNWLSSQLDNNFPTQSSTTTDVIAYPGRVQFNFYAADPNHNFSIPQSQMSILPRSDRQFSSLKKIVNLMIFFYNIFFSAINIYIYMYIVSCIMLCFDYSIYVFINSSIIIYFRNWSVFLFFLR